MNRSTKFLPAVMLAIGFVLMLALPAMAGKAPLITIDELKQMLDDPDLVILDVRTGRDWKSSEFKIQGAVRTDPGDFAKLADQYGKNKKYVTYCA